MYYEATVYGAVLWPKSWAMSADLIFKSPDLILTFGDIFQLIGSQKFICRLQIVSQLIGNYSML